MFNLENHKFALVSPGELVSGDIIDGDKNRYLVLGSSDTAVHNNVSLYLIREDDPEDRAFWIHYYYNHRLYAYIQDRK